MAKKALMVWGGWGGHEPKQCVDVFEPFLREQGFEVEVSDSMDVYTDADKMNSLSLIVPVWTMGQISGPQEGGLLGAIANGVGVAGWHGGMCDAFRNNTNYQFMTGGQWVAHPGNDGTPYLVNIRSSSNPITEGIADFEVKSEQYYVHVDPAVEVLASTLFPNPAAVGFHSSNPLCAVPVVWTKRWGHGRVFYNSLGHHADIFDASEPIELMRRGFLWAADGKDRAVQLGLKLDDFLPKT